MGPTAFIILSSERMGARVRVSEAQRRGLTLMPHPTSDHCLLHAATLQPSQGPGSKTVVFIPPSENRSLCAG